MLVNASGLLVGNTGRAELRDGIMDNIDRRLRDIVSKGIIARWYSNKNK